MAYGVQSTPHIKLATRVGACCSPASALCRSLYDCQRWCQPRAVTCMLLHRRRDRRATVLHTARPSMPVYARLCQVTALVSNVDIAPTLIDLAGALCRPLTPLELTHRLGSPRVVSLYGETRMPRGPPCLRLAYYIPRTMHIHRGRATRGTWHWPARRSGAVVARRYQPSCEHQRLGQPVAPNLCRAQQGPRRRHKQARAAKCRAVCPRRHAPRLSLTAHRSSCSAMKGLREARRCGRNLSCCRCSAVRTTGIS